MHSTLNIFVLLTSVCCLSTIVIFIYLNKKNDVENIPNIIWWTSFYPKNIQKIIECKSKQCLLTNNRNNMNNNVTKAFLFYGSHFDLLDLPLPRSQTIWALLHEESPKNNAALLFEDVLELFNFSSTFSRHSTFPLTLQYLPNLDLLIDSSKYLPVAEKNILLSKYAPILYLQSDCDTPIDRDSFVLELMKHISVDSYGRCLNNKKLPKSLYDNPLNNLFSDDLIKFISRYKFVISFENSICDDYITEKLWRPLVSGSVPIYKGAPTVKEWLPNANSIISVDEFKSIEKLAEYIKMINNNDTLYNSFLQHKLKRNKSDRITNNFLLKNVKTRVWGTNFDETKEHFINKYECLICEKLHSLALEKEYKVTQDHYQCYEPENTNVWISHWKNGKCEAKAAKYFLEVLKLSNYTKETFDMKIQDLEKQKEC